ncbi:MAG: sugar phosphate isomerase/epimerase [Lentisphaerae bacterium]|jgi:sugar phosphate isomerase/epimerase|nr:sugar phosphate isomerase/epimerase [Lentisphaerota bacterium]MBT4823363.1 sugar phosphate isomerase/epimerase [Lentisphaerota bacterium]MBT5605917.1 sugar phosphate isomerase/epimerase [Lentisphaerota bacterium]MBT7057996.1 sugar phosphate isomerase/epimerase [Lentisphaerota bacterium]MBT7848551.1 sugar phosphate isomerase/epimerase [Lentisphaerota bacterium]
MANVIACRTGMFGSAEAAFERFPEAGILNAEAPPPGDGDYAGLAASAAAAGVTISTLSTGLPLDTDETAAAFNAVIDGAAAIGVSKVFVSAKAGEDVPRDAVLSRFRVTADYAAAQGVVICMETHPPFGTNGDLAKATIEAVGSPGLRFNFDTANVYYYNENTDTISELKKAADLVAAVHIKDTDGGFKSGNFPEVGTGVVDFPGVFELLGGLGFEGPYTLEVEGALVKDLDHDQRLVFLRRCMDYLDSIGAVG